LIPGPGIAPTSDRRGGPALGA